MSDEVQATETTPLEPRSSDETPALVPAPPSADELTRLAPGALVVGRYRIVALLGRGGMGAVYRAQDLVLGQPVALKFLTAGGGRQALELLAAEVRMGRRVTHPNVCRLHDVVESAGQRFLVMEYVEGEDLASLLKRLGSLPHETALALARDVAAGLAAAHDEGIVHRDLKPGNVMVDGRGRARVTDFGLAIAATDAAGRREVAGTPAYMAPEQLRGQAVDARADIYALGLIVCELLTGQRLNQGRQLADLRASPADVPPALTPWAPQIDPRVERFVLRALDPDPARRPASARELLALLPEPDPLGSALAAGETPTPEMIAAAARRGTLRPAVALGLAAAGVAGLLAAAALAQSTRLVILARQPPGALQTRAREVVRSLAPELQEAHAVCWYEADRERLRSAEYRATRSLAQVAALAPGPLRFVHRQGEAPLLARNATETVSNLSILQSGKVTRDDPPLGPGMATVVLDRDGGLLWAEAVTRDGQKLRQPPGEPAPPGPRRSSGLQLWMEASKLALMFGSLAAALVFARRNRRRGRGDPRGATRVAFYAFVSLLLSWLLTCDHVPDPAGEGQLFSVAFGAAATAAVLLWVFYMALEPVVRRGLPQALISWSRLLNGRVGDSLVTRDLLLGLLGGVAGRLLVDVGQLLPALWGGHPRFFSPLYALLPARKVLGNLLLLQVDAIEFGIGGIFLLVLLQRAVRRPWLAGALWLAVFGAAALALPAVIPYLLLLLVWLLRFGLLATVAAALVASVLTVTSLTLDPTAWFFGRSLATLGLLAASAMGLALLTARGGSTMRP